MGAALLVLTERSSAQAANLPPMGWAQAPSFRDSHVPQWGSAYAYFPPTDRVVVFGGQPKVESEGWSNQTWRFGGAAWKKGSTAPPGLTARGGAAMAYDPDIGKIVLFGGEGPAWPPLADTWLYDGTAWTPGPAAHPGMAGRTGAEMVYDDAIGKLVLFGGTGTEPYADTWLFDGSGWTQGPAPPPQMAARAFFGMAYDPGLGKVVVVGGDGGSDVWEFDGSSWTQGPPLAAGALERVRLAYDPDIGADLLFGGMTETSATAEMWMLRDGVWAEVPSSTIKPSARLDAGVVWYPRKDSLLVFGGIANGSNGQGGLNDAWYFRDTAPEVSSVSLSPSAPNQSQKIALAMGTVIGGYKAITYAFRWFVNGSMLPGATGKSISSGYAHGDEVTAQVQATDSVGMTGPWISSPAVPVIDRAPTMGSASISPSKLYTSSTATATVTNVNDPDGDTVTLHYVWTVNGLAAGGDSPTLTPDRFTAGDQVAVTVGTVDSVGTAGESGSAGPKAVSWNLSSPAAAPGASASVKGNGFAAGERVAVRLDSPDGTTLATATADSTGSFPSTTITIPSPLAGGSHMLDGVGLTSGIVGSGPLTVNSAGSIYPVNLASGDVTTYTGVGFVPGEQVSMSFPFDTPTVATADGTGSVAATLTSPPEPDGVKGVITASAPSGTSVVHFYTLARFTSPSSAEPGDSVAISLTGYGASETVSVNFDSDPVIRTLATDAQGSLSADLLLSTTFGSHKITIVGATSGTLETNSISLPSWITLSPTSGPVGTVVTIDSGPGWIAGETVQLKWGSAWQKDLTADSSGSVHTTFAIPNHSPGSVNIVLSDDILAVSPKAPFAVTA